ncbi:MAG: methyltransferase [Bacteroidota bacterium]
MVFRFKQFSIDDSNCAMKIGTDGCLLGAWADVENASGILDIGTGSGVIALMLAQRSNATIDAVEIDYDAYGQALKNFSESPWENRLNAFHSSIQEYIKSCTKKYDMIVCCPPYFLNSLKATDKKRRLARHTDSLTFEELISGSLRLLKPEGKFCTIIPTESRKLFYNIALIEGYHTVKITEIEPKAGATPVRVLLQMQRNKIPCTRSKIPILDIEGKLYTPEYIELTRDFYIIF